MAVQYDGLDITFEADADLSAKQYYIVKLTGNNRVNVPTAATDTPLGVLQNKPKAAGRGAVVRVAGVTKVIAGGAISAGDKVGTDAAGKAVAKTAANDKVLGLALQSAAANDLFAVLIEPHVL